MTAGSSNVLNGGIITGEGEIRPHMVDSRLPLGARRVSLAINIFSFTLHRLILWWESDNIFPMNPKIHPITLTLLIAGVYTTDIHPYIRR